MTTKTPTAPTKKTPSSPAKTSKTPTKRSPTKAATAAAPALSYEEMLGARPGGGRWRPIEVEAARLRAEGFAWEQVHEAITAKGIKYKLRSLSNLTYKPWWAHAYAFFAGLRTSAVETAKAAEVEAERDKWRDEDAKLKAFGTHLAMTKLIEVLQGLRPRDELLYRSLILSGLSKDEANAQARQKQKMPAPPDVVWAAREMLKATGYTTQNEAIAKAAVESEVEARKAAGTPSGADKNGAMRVLKVSVEMDGVTLGPPDADEAADGDS